MQTRNPRQIQPEPAQPGAQPRPLATPEAEALTSAQEAFDAEIARARKSGEPDFARLDALAAAADAARGAARESTPTKERAAVAILRAEAIKRNPDVFQGRGRTYQGLETQPLSPLDRTLPPQPGANYLNPATRQLVAADPKPKEAGTTRVSPMGNTYQVIGEEKVAEMKKDPHLSVMMEGYETAIANTSTTYADAQYRLSQDVKEIRGSARGANWNGESPEGKATEAKAQALLKTWDRVAGTYAGYDPKISAAKFVLEDKAAGLIHDGVISLRREAGIDEDGYLLPGFDRVKVRPTGYEGLTQDEARKKCFLDYFPLGTEAQYRRMIHDPNYDQGPNYLGFEINALASPNWGLGRWAEQNARSARPRPPELGKAAPWRYGEPG